MKRLKNKIAADRLLRDGGYLAVSVHPRGNKMFYYRPTVAWLGR